jgi:hypothetical protein
MTIYLWDPFSLGITSKLWKVGAVHRISRDRSRVNRAGGNRSGNRGNQSYRSGPFPVPTGCQPVQIQNLNLNSKNKKISQNSQKYFKVC